MKQEIHFVAGHDGSLIELLHEQTAISKTQLKKALNFGGVWIKIGGKGKKLRCRRATKALQSGDNISLHYDPSLYNQPLLAPQVLLEKATWGAWLKPANVLAQGSPFGDFGCMENQVKQLAGKKQVHLIHRLDREVAGIMLIAYDSRTAGALSEQWHSATQKFYQAIALGQVSDAASPISVPLDGKNCTTHFRVIRANEEFSQVEIELSSGRFHQIRRHFDAIGHPLMGDPRYGHNNKNSEGLRLVAHQLVFTCPLSKQIMDIRLSQQHRLF